MQPAGPIFLNSQYDGIDEHLRGDESAFLGRASFQSANFVKHWSDIHPSPPGGYGAESLFTLQNDTDYLGPIELIYSFNAVTADNAPAVGDAAIFPRYVRWLGFAAIERAVLRFHSERLQEFTGDDLMVIYAIRTRLEDRRDALIGEPGDRGADTAAKQGLRHVNSESSDYKVYVPLHLLMWGKHTGTFLPYARDVANGKLTITIQTRPLSALVEHDADGTDANTCTGTINYLRLRMQKVDVTDAEQRAIMTAVRTPSKQLGLSVHGRLVTTQENQDNVSVADSSGWQEVDLVCNRPTKELICYWRHDGDLPDGTFKGSQDRFNFQPITDIGLRGSNRPILDDCDAEWLRMSVQNKLHKGNTSEFNIYTIPHSFAPDADSDAIGYLNYGNIDERKLRFKTGGTAGKMNILCQVKNTLKIDASGYSVIQK